MHQIARIFLTALAFLGVLLMVPPAKPASAAAVVYAKPTATGNGDCSSWDDACTLQAALSLAANGDEIWVAGGTYTPHASNRTASFVLESGVGVYGGYAGTGPTPNQRDIAANPTILSGDIGAQGNNSDNSYHVVVGSGTDDTAVLDGFTITGGLADGASPPHNIGGGILNQGGSPTLRNLTFDGNSADYGGGMMNESGSSPTLENVTFASNAAIDGAGIYNDSNSPALTNVTFSGNMASSGAGGGMYNAFSSPTLINVTFAGNGASSGGGLHNAFNSSPTLINVIIAGSSSGGDCVDDGTSPLTALSSHNLIEDGAAACGLAPGVNGNVVGSDPKLAPLADNGGPNQTFALLADSPAINAGSCDASLGVPQVDQRGVARPQGARCDIGAFERDTIIRYAKPEPDGLASGSCDSWATACTFQFALGSAVSGEEIWVAQGVYTPTARLDLANPRSATFSLNSGVRIYGGFAGTGSQRDIAAYATILSGDLDGNDDPANASSRDENAYHVVVGSGTDSSAVLDGLTITGGNANNFPGPGSSGGGMLNQSGSPKLENVVFSNNSANEGGGINNLGSPTLTNVTFSGNSAIFDGGGIYNIGSPALTNVTFSGNSAGNSGGGMVNISSSPALTNVTFSGNSADNGGGMYNLDVSNPTLTNVTFSGNSADNQGGGMYNVHSSPKLINVIIANSTKGGDCGNFFNTLDAASRNNLIADSANACGLNDGDNGNIIGSDPKLAPLADNGGAIHTHALLPGSPAINKGDNSACPATDQRGVARPQGSACDIGAYEADPPYGGTIFIDPDIITSRDITAFQGATYAGQGMRWMFDRRVNDWIQVNAYLFDATFSDGLTIEVQVNPEFADATAAEAVTLKYCEVIGRIPTVLRKDVQTVWIHKGNQPFGGGNNNLLIHTEQGDAYEASGILEETFVHEASHTSLDSTHSAAPGWLAAQSSDGNFISTYARDFPDREDIAESFLTYLAIRYRSDRISQADYDAITLTIPNRIAYFDSQAFDVYPMNLIYETYLPMVTR